MKSVLDQPYAGLQLGGVFVRAVHRVVVVDHRGPVAGNFDDGVNS